MKKNIAVITGGNSSEYVIAVKSADTVIENLNPEKYDAYRVEIKGADWKVVISDKENIQIDKNDFTFQRDGKKTCFDGALIIIHGDPGEDGKLQGYLEMLGMPYAASDVLTSSLTFNKHFTKQYLKSYNILSADWVLLNKRIGFDIAQIEDKIGFPCFVKPNNAGSSFGVSKVSSHGQLVDAIDNAMTEDEEVLIEKMIAGTEITCGVLRTPKAAYMFPITEIVSKTGFFDYEAKYTVGKSDEIIPARIDNNIAEQCKELSLKIYDLFNCKWFARIDYILNNNNLYLLEVNTIPGMSRESIIPKMVRAANMSLTLLLDEILSDIFV